MNNIIIAVVLLIVSSISYGQKSVKELDKELRKTTKAKLKKVEIGNRSNGWAVFYNKDDKTVFSVTCGEIARANNVTDSVLRYAFNFKNDTLFRIYFSRLDMLNHKNGFVVVYIEGEKIIAQEMKGDIYLLLLESLKYKAGIWLSKAKEVITKK